MIITPNGTDSHADDTTDTGAVQGFVIEAAGGTIQNLTIDGGAGENFRQAILADSNSGWAGANGGGLTVDHVTVKNIFRKGIALYSRNGLVSGNVITGDTFSNVGNLPGNEFEASFAIADFSASGTITNNTITGSGAGIGTNFLDQNPADGPSVIVSGNSFSDPSTGMGYPAVGLDISGANTGSVVSGNTVNLTGGASDLGIVVQYDSVPLTVSGNSVTTDGGDVAFYLYQDSATTAATLSDNTATGTATDTGILLTDDGSIFAETAHVGTTYGTLTGNSLSGFGTGIEVSSTGTNPVFAAIGTIAAGSNTINGGAGSTGILVSGPEASATISDNSSTIENAAIGVDVEGGATATVSGNVFSGNGLDVKVGTGSAITTLTNNSFSGTDFISNLGTAAIDASSDTFNVGTGNARVAGSALSLSQVYGVEDRITDYLDNPADGYVSLNATQVFVSQGSEDVTAEAIQRGIDVAPAGGTLNLQAGSFVVNADVTTSMTILGAGQGSTTVYPAVSNPEGGSLGSAVFEVDSNNVAIRNLTIDGDNPALAGNVNTQMVGGVPVDASSGVVTNWGARNTYTGMTVEDVTIQNIYERGIEYATSNVGGGTGTFDFENNTVTNVNGDPDEAVSIFNDFGNGIMAGNIVSDTPDALSTNWSTGTVIHNNTVMNAGSGIHVDNNGGAGGTGDSIYDNNVSAGEPDSLGIWVFVPYDTVTVYGNQISGVDEGLAAYGGAGGSAEFSNNTVSVNAGGTGALVTTDQLGHGDGAVSASFSGDSFTGGAVGISVVQNDAETATATISGGTAITGGVTGVLVSGSNATVAFTGSDPATISGQSGDYITLENGAENGLTVDASEVRFGISGGVYQGANASLPGDLPTLYGIEDKISDYLDTPGVGYVSLNTGNVFVDQKSENTTDDSMQRGINVVPSGGTVYVQAGTYTGNLVIDHPLALDGAAAGTDARRRSQSVDVSTLSEIDGTLPTVNITADTGTVTISGMNISEESRVGCGIGYGGRGGADDCACGG